MVNKFNKCLVITRHNLLQTQQQDIYEICEHLTISPELPNEALKIKETIGQYDAVVGVLPPQLQIQILNTRKTLITFAMNSIGVAKTKEEAESIASQYPGRAVILPPSREGEQFRISRYDGIKLIKEIRIIDEWLIKH